MFDFDNYDYLSGLDDYNYIAGGYYEPDQCDMEYAAAQAVVYLSNFSYLLLRGTPVEVAREMAVEAVKTLYGVEHYNAPVSIDPCDKPF